MKSLDFLQLVIFKKIDEPKHFSLKLDNDETLMMVGIPRFIFRIEEVLGHFKVTTYNRSYYQRKEMEIMENKSRYLMKITGFFFLLENYKEKLLKISEILTDVSGQLKKDSLAN